MKLSDITSILEAWNQVDIQNDKMMEAFINHIVKNQKTLSFTASDVHALL